MDQFLIGGNTIISGCNIHISLYLSSISYKFKGNHDNRSPESEVSIYYSASGEVIATFGDDGNLLLHGSLKTNVSTITENPSSKEWRVEAYDQTILALIELETGNMQLKGNVFENQGSSTLTPLESQSEFIIKKGDTAVIRLDEDGNLYIKGDVYTFVHFD